MSNSKSNFPQAQIDEMDKPAVQQMVTDLKQLYDMGKPESNMELKQRIDDYFAFCQQSAIRPGIESLCLSLHISRTTLFNWSYGIGCDNERKEIIECAKAFISSFLEQAALSGRISPPTGIFLLKNWCNYRDSYSFENMAEEARGQRPEISMEELHRRREEIKQRYAEHREMPEKPDFD